MILNTEKGQKKAKIFSCDFCAFVTQRKDKWDRHLLTLKHQLYFSPPKKGQKGHEKGVKIYCCEKCNYNTLYKIKWERHLLTLKHKTPPFVPKGHEKGASNFACKYCRQDYSSMHGLMVHQNKCAVHISELALVEQNAVLIEKNHLLADKNQELTNKIIEICSKMPPPVIMNNSNTNTFNLHFFLNETCKDAMTLADFVSSIQLELTDLEETGRLGFSGGISTIITNTLNKMETKYRPMHCTDSKRETIYIKTDTEWQKDDNNEQLTAAIKQIANKNIQNILPWRELHPECSNATSRKNDQYLKIVGNSMSGGDHAEIKRNIGKIISNIAKEVVVDK